MASIKKGTTVQLGTQKSIPVRYQGRRATVVGFTQNSNGTNQVLVTFPSNRRAQPLAVNQRFATAL